MTITPFLRTWPKKRCRIRIQVPPTLLEKSWIMAIRRKWINYTVYAPDYEPGKGCWDFRTVVKARLAAKKLGAGSWLRRNINLNNKGAPGAKWWVDREWEWNGKEFVKISHNSPKELL